MAVKANTAATKETAAKTTTNETVETKEVKKETAKKPAAKKTATKKATETKTAAKTTKTTTTNKKAAEVAPTYILQFSGKEVFANDVLGKVKTAWVEQFQGKVEEITSIEIYLKPEEHKAYFVINGLSNENYFVEL